jgi:hypothetical protein
MNKMWRLEFLILSSSIHCSTYPNYLSGMLLNVPTIIFRTKSSQSDYLRILRQDAVGTTANLGTFQNSGKLSDLQPCIENDLSSAQEGYGNSLVNAYDLFTNMAYSWMWVEGDRSSAMHIGSWHLLIR